MIGNGVHSDSNFSFHLKSTIELNGSPNTSNDIPTSLLVIPIASQKVSANGIAEWTCIAVGYSSGLLQLYTEVSLLSSVTN